MQLDVAVDSLSADSPEKPRFERVHEMIKRLVSQGRETVKGLRSTSTEKEKFEELFFEMREEFDVNRALDFRVNITGQARTLHPIIHDEVRHIAQEAVFNAFRHAEAARIEVSIEYSARKFFLSVRDDGRGIEPDIVASGRKGHWGLTGMRERADNIGSLLKVWSAKGQGTEIELTIPGRVAYKDPDLNPLSKLVETFTGRFRRRPDNSK